MNDLISRSAAIEAVTNADRNCLGAHGAREAIRALPAASQPEAEPVAWVWLAGGGWGTILHGNDKPLGEARPLYAHPVQEPPSPGVTAGATGPERIWAWSWLTQPMGQWGVQPSQGTVEYIRADLATPAPVVPAEGPISTLEMVYRNMPDIPELPEAYQPRNIARSLAALRSAPPVEARVSIPSGLIDALRSQRQIDADGCEVAVSRQACDEAAAILAALLPAGEGV